MNEKTAVELLKNAKKSLDNHKVEFWLRDGTILGAVRDRGFIPWDTDIDIGIWSKDFDKLVLVQDDMKDLGYETAIHNSRTPFSLNIVKDDCDMDIASFDLNNGNIYEKHIEQRGVIGEILDYLLWVLNLRIERKLGRISDETTKKLIRFCKLVPNCIRQGLVVFFDNIYTNVGTSRYIKTTPGHFYTNLTKIDFYGMQINIPTEIEEYLEYRYGKDWSVPKEQSGFDGLKDGLSLG